MARALTSGVVELHPHEVGVASGGPRGEGFEVRMFGEDDVFVALKVFGVDHHVSGDQRAGAAGSPSLVEAAEAAAWVMVWASELFAHGSFDDPVLETSPAWKRERLGQQRRSLHRHFQDS